MFYLPILGTPSGTRHPSSLFKSHANNTNLSTLICNSKRPVEKTLKIAESFRHLFWVEHKTYSRSLHQRWSILLQMTTLSAALEGSGPEVRVIVGLQLWVQRWRQMCLLLGWALSSDRENMKHGWGLPYSWKVVIILFPVFNYMQLSRVTLCAPTYCSVLTSMVIMEFKKNVIPFPSILQASNHQPCEMFKGLWSRLFQERWAVLRGRAEEEEEEEEEAKKWLFHPPGCLT